MIAVTAEEALEEVRTGRHLVCFAKEDQLRVVEQLIARYVITHNLKTIRLEPSVENAETMQLSRYPAFILYDDGSEAFNVVGHDKLEEALRRTIR